ncbi:MAG: hypothetical protein KAI47_15525 [Deltaproteobacteria bacterium]|nr:hypothetical protein [Deltaproteobacteria bacterium]
MKCTTSADCDGNPCGLNGYALCTRPPITPQKDAGVTQTDTSGAGADKLAPQVAIDSPAALAIIGPEINLIATITDNIGVVSAEVFVDGISATTKNQAPWTFPLKLSVGSRKLEVRAKDAAGNLGVASVTVTVEAAGSPPNPGPQKGGYGSACQGPAECLTGLCANWGAEPAFCTQLCDAKTPCPTGSACETITGGQSICAPSKPTIPIPRPEVAGSCTIARNSEDSDFPGGTLEPLLLLLGLVTLRRRRRLRITT